MIEQCEGCGVLPGYICKVCKKNTCPNCDTYYYIIGGDGYWIDDPEHILELANNLEGHVAHHSCVDQNKLVNLEDHQDEVSI
jgi:hypothetical protein